MLARLKENPPTAEIPLVVLCEEDEPNRALYLGAIDYLTKPVSRERLKQSLEAVGVPFASEPVTCADRRAS
jgi:CheY-like chemotaxis protein